MKVGFTGTRNGMSGHQMAALREVLRILAPESIACGDCVGADHEAALIAYGRGIPVIGHPPQRSEMRACFAAYVMEHPPLPYAVRNRNIVDACDCLIAAPADPLEQVQGGTWMTLRMARKAGKPRCILWPDGRVEWEQHPEPGT